MYRNQFFLLISSISYICLKVVALENDLGFGRWYRPVLTYSIHRYPESGKHPRMTSSRMRRHVDTCMDKSVRLWAPAVNVKFQKLAPGENSDIKVFFYSSNHGDSYAFDGSGGEVAHTFYPDERKRGEIHIDDDEPWGPDGRNLEWVLGHEMGHALGLPHQKGPSLMEYGYRGYRNTPKLTIIDRLAAAELYAN